MARIFTGLPLNKTLRGIALNSPSPKRNPPKEKMWIAKFSREQILDMRTKHELEGWTVKQIRDHFGLTASEAYRYLNYLTAKDVIPKSW
jgi:AraC-like DNA-binding protein